MNIERKYLLAALFVLSFPTQTLNAEILISNGDLYDGESLIGEKSPITSTHGHIEKYIISPTKQFVLYFQFSSYVNSAGDFEDVYSWPQDQLFKLGIFDTNAKKTINLLTPPEGYFYRFEKWTNDDKALIHLTSGLSVDGYIVFDARENVLREVSYEEFDVLLTKSAQPIATPDAGTSGPRR